MKTITKVLSMLLVIVMCASIFGVSAYADAPLKKGVSGETGVISEKKSLDIDEELPEEEIVSSKKEVVEEEVEEIEEEKAPMLLTGMLKAAPSTPGVAEIAGGSGTYTLPAAISTAGNGSTINLLDDIDLDANLNLNKDITLNLNGFTLNLGDSFRIIASGNVSIKNGTIWGHGRDIASAGSSLKLYDVKLDKTPAESFVPAGYHVTGPDSENWYTVEAGSDPAPEQPCYDINTNEYEKDSGDTVYILVPKDDTAKNYYIYGSKLIELRNGQNCEYKLDGNYYRWTLYNNALLNTLTAGETYYFCYRDASDNKVYYMCDSLDDEIYLNVKKASSKGDLDLYARYDDEWYQGDNPLQFVVDPYPGSTNNIQISVDGKRLGNLDWYDYHSGYLYLGTSFLQSLDSGWHTLKIKAVGGPYSGAYGECDFYVGPSLVARDTDKHVTGSSRTLKFVCSEPINRIWVGDKELDGYDDYYTLSKDRKTITLTAKFLNNRTAGNTYTLTVETDSGERISAPFQILTTAQGSASPRTGDESNFALWAALLVMSGAAAVVVLPKLRKHED